MGDRSSTNKKSAVVADTMKLCEELARMAAFVENKEVQQKIYKTVRQLQLLEQLAAPEGKIPCIPSHSM